MKLFSLAVLGLAASFASHAGAQTNLLRVPTEATRSGEKTTDRTDAAARAFARNAALLTAKNRAQRARFGLVRAGVPFTLPMRVELTKNGVPLGTVPSGRAREITLDFDPTFPVAYRTFLQTVFNNAKSTITAVYGEPAVAGTVRVVNYDASIGDRDAIAGGYYLPNDGTGVRQIRFPIFSNNEAAAVNLVHTVLLAYAPDAGYGFDAFSEGIARAATMRIVRQRSAVPTLDADLVENVLANTYDVGPRYDWNNQPALSGSRFIAPNLRDTPLPAGGSLGGLYLLRYQMAGSAFQKVLAEYPTFLARYNARFLANTTIRNNRDALVALGQTVLNELRAGDPTVEGLSFTEWARRQSILDTDMTLGVKLHVEPIALTTDVGQTEAGAFLLQASYFETTTGGNETLLSATSYPVAWTNTYERVFPNTGGERVDVAGAYGAYAPSYDQTNTTTSYRSAVDFPIGDRIQRVYLPVGTVRDGNDTATSDLYGTVVGASGTGLTVTVAVGSQTFTAPVVNNAFGILTNNANFQGTRSVVVTLSQNGTPLLVRRVNKGPGPLELDLRVGDYGTFTLTGGLRRGISLFGLPVDPTSSSAARVFAASPANTLLARYNSARARYDRYPLADAFRQGDGLFIRSETAVPNFSVYGRRDAGTAIAVALRPGWNLVANPLSAPVATSAIDVVRGGDAPVPYVSAVGTLIGADIFGFVPGSPDPASGAVETGTFVADNLLETGSGFFVRCLAPEGATLLFRPANLNGRAANAVPGPEFLTSVTLVGEGERTRAEIAQGLIPTYRYASALPPSLGGVQAVIGGSLYREVTGLGTAKVSTIDLNNLRAGRTYRVDIVVERGKAKSVTMRDPALGRTLTLTKSASYTFRATGTTRRLTLEVKGATK